jgi:hypothetical protein
MPSSKGTYIARQLEGKPAKKYERPWRVEKPVLDVRINVEWGVQVSR